jgi:hypothetical protein
VLCAVGAHAPDARRRDRGDIVQGRRTGRGITRPAQAASGAKGWGDPVRRRSFTLARRQGRGPLGCSRRVDERLRRARTFFAATAVAEIIGCLPDLWLRRGATARVLIPAAVSWAICAPVFTLDSHGSHADPEPGVAKARHAPRAIVRGLAPVIRVGSSRWRVADPTLVHVYFESGRSSCRKQRDDGR